MKEGLLPQPYPDNLTPHITNDGVVLARMFHFAAGMEAVAEHSLMEGHVSHLLARLLGSNQGPSIAIFEGLSGAQAQARALKRVAQEVLNADDQALLKRVMASCKLASDARDAICHRLWLMDHQLPHAVILYEPSAMWRLSLRADALNETNQVTDATVMEVQVQIKKASQVWTLPDFDLAKRQAGGACVAVAAFYEATVLGDTPAGVEKRRQIDELLLRDFREEVFQATGNT